MCKKTNVVIVDKEENSRNLIKCYLSEIEDICVSAEFFDYELGCDFVLGEEDCIVLFDISDDEKKCLDYISKIKNSKKNISIIALSVFGKHSTDTIIKALRAGAKEVISKPIIKNDLVQAVETLKASINKNTTQCACKVISTFSNKGGIGKTSIAVNLASELALMSKEKVALIDLNLQLGDVSTFLDMTPAFAMDYIAKNIQNLDEQELLQSLSRYKNTTLYVIADPLNIDKSQEITAEQIKTIIETLKKSFSYIVIDIGTNIDSKTITALDLSDLILLIAIANLPAIRSTQRCMDLFNKLGYTKDKIKLVLNRYMENEEIKTADIEDVVKQKVYWKIPNNYLTMVSAINKGVPVNEINRESNVAQNYMNFATKLSDYLITKNLNI